MFSHESTGTPVESNNGYLLGKRTMDITVAMWKEDIRNGCLIKSELLKDYPKWFLETTGVLNIQPSFDGYKWWISSIISKQQTRCNMSTILTISASCESGNNVSISYKGVEGETSSYGGNFLLKDGESRQVFVGGCVEITAQEISMTTTA